MARTVALVAALGVAALALSGCTTDDVPSARRREGDRDATAVQDAQVDDDGAIPTRGQECPDPHWHATFAVFLPGEDGSPRRVDFAAPEAEPGLAYYDYDASVRGGAPDFDAAVHMHQGGYEAGPEGLGPAQWHFERKGRCVPVQAALLAVDVEVVDGGLDLTGGHQQVAGQAGRFEPAPGESLRFWVEEDTACGEWEWRETDWAMVRGRQLADGDALLVALGDFTDEQVAEMQDGVPAPMSRIQGDCEA
jgi:hypothetical protein